MPHASSVPPIARARAPRTALLLACGIFAATLLAYLPALRADFIWNDSDYVTSPALQSLDGLRRIWTDVGATEQYYPLLHTSFWLQHRLWGDSPVGYHVFNVLLHAAAACLFGALLRRLAVPGAALAAFVFALHPVCVESVAWISEQKNTLSLVFYLGAALLYLRFEAGRETDPRRARLAYRAATLVFAAALLSKTTTATLPPALLVIAWWRRGRLEWRRDVVPLLPWFVLGAVMGLFSAWVEKHFIGAAGSEFALSFTQRGLLAGRIVWFYLGKLLLPLDLIFIYPRWTIDPGSFAAWLYPLALLALLAGLWRLRRRNRAPLAALLLFAGSLFPVLGFFNVYAFIFSFVADHWQYLPALAIVGVGGAVLARAPRLIQAALIVALGLLTWQQSRMYADMETFYRVTLERNPDSWMAHNNLGSMLRFAGAKEAAIVHYEAALRIKPDAAKTQDNLGIMLREQRRVAEALPHFEAAVKLEPDNAAFHDNLAGALRDLHRTREAVPHHREALRIDPTSSAAHNNYGVTLRELGRADAAIAEFETALRCDPNNAPAHMNLMLSYWTAGREAEARRHYEEARRLNPAIPEIDLSVRPGP